MSLGHTQTRQQDNKKQCQNTRWKIMTETLWIVIWIHQPCCVLCFNFKHSCLFFITCIIHRQLGLVLCFRALTDMAGVMYRTFTPFCSQTPYLESVGIALLCQKIFFFFMKQIWYTYTCSGTEHFHLMKLKHSCDFTFGHNQECIQQCRHQMFQNVNKEMCAMLL